MERKRKTSRFHPRLAGRKCFRRLCNPHCLRLYLMVLGLLALWEGRSEVVLGCLGALLTLSGYGDGERHDGKRKQKQQLPVVAGWGLLMYAAVSCFC